MDASDKESEAGCALNTDEELYARFLCGEDEALRQLMERYFERLTLFCATFLNSVAEAEEMALDAFAVVALKRAAWHGGSFRSWLYRIARNLSVSRYRALKFIAVPFDEAYYLTASSTEADYWRQEETSTLLALLDRLPEAERRVLSMIYLENASYAQAAQALGMDEKRVDNLAYRGKKRLREWLRQEEGEHE